MARSSYPQRPHATGPSQQQPRPAGDPRPEPVPLANRIALLTFLTAFATVLGLVLLPRALAGGPVIVRLAAALPLLIAIGLVLYVRRLRSELHRDDAPAENPHGMER